MTYKILPGSPIVKILFSPGFPVPQIIWAKLNSFVKFSIVKLVWNVAMKLIFGINSPVAVNFPIKLSGDEISPVEPLYVV